MTKPVEPLGAMAALRQLQLRRMGVETRIVTGGHVRFLPGLRQVGAVINTEDVGDDGVVVVSAGMDFAQFRDKNSPALWGHDHMRPVAKCVDIRRIGSEIHATAEFPEPGVSADSDTVYGLIKAGIISAVSTGFIPLDMEPMRGVPGGRRITR